MEHTGFRANLDAWRQGKATPDDVEAALREELMSEPRAIPAALALIKAYRQAGHLPAQFAERLMSIESGLAAPPAGRPELRPAPFCGYVPGVSTAAPTAPVDPEPDRTLLRPPPVAGKAAPAPATDIESKTVFRPAAREAALPAHVVNPRNRTTAAGAVQPAARSALPFAPEPQPVGVQAFGDGMTPKQRPVKLLLAGAAALVLVLIAAVLLTAGILDRRRVEGIELALVSPEPKIADDAARQLSSADEDTRVAVLSTEGMKAKVRAVFERQTRSAFDPQQHLFDYSRAQAILDRAARLLPDDEPLRQHKLSLERMRKLELNSLDESFAKALAGHDLLQDSGPSSLVAVRQIIATLEPSDPLLRDSRVPLAFRDAAAAALAKPDLDLADRLVHEGLSIAPGNPDLGDVADRVRRAREKRVGLGRR